MHPTDTSRGRVLGIPKPLLAGLAVVLAAVSFTAVYSRRAPDAGDGSPSPTTAPAAGPQTAQSASTPSGTAQTPGMVVTFRLDPSVTRGLYLGDRWVSPPTFHFAQPGTQYVVQAKLQSIDEWDERVDLSGEWSTSDPEMIAITRHDHGEVTIMVRRAGEGQLFVSAGGVTKVLRVQARQTADAMDVVISQ